MRHIKKKTITYIYIICIFYWFKKTIKGTTLSRDNRDLQFEKVTGMIAQK